MVLNMWEKTVGEQAEQLQTNKLWSEIVDDETEVGSTMFTTYCVHGSKRWDSYVL
jgi:hypothetical protein